MRLPGLTSGRRPRRRHASFGRNLRQLEAGEDRCVVVPDEDRLRREVAVQDRCVVHRLAMQLVQGVQRGPREGQPRRGVPGPVRCALLKGRGQRVGDGEEVHLARVAGGRLPGVEHTRRPGVQLQPTQCLALPAGPRFRVRCIACRQVVEVQNDLVLAGGVDAPIDAVEPLDRGRAPFEVDVAGEPPQRAVEGDSTPGFQATAEKGDLLRAQRWCSVEVDGLAPLFQRAEPHTPDDPAGQLRHVRRFARQQDHAVHAAEVRYGLARGGPDLAGLVRDLVRLLFHEVRVLIDPSPRPVLDLDDAHARRTDGHHVDLVRLELVRDRPGEVGQQNPQVAVAAERRFDAVFEMFECGAFALVGERPAVDWRHSHFVGPGCRIAVEHTTLRGPGPSPTPAMSWSSGGTPGG